MLSTKKREPRNKPAKEKKDVHVIGKIRGLGNVTLGVGEEMSTCQVSGKRTNLMLSVSGFIIYCHSAFFDQGLSVLRKRTKAVTATC
ncbi:MAG: hypothetical protein UT48_C0027G0005 [Parcubacteria group bacterium GW2011_GWE2_39_37]|nr:MAG: hypothetical protein UT48_C0027G0005 [Parcubacteria group bacterium GW2011_GWE2_39_37]